MMTLPAVCKTLKNRDFLTVADLTPQELKEILALAADLKSQRKQGKEHHLLAGKSIAMYFEKPSNRTRISFEVGIVDLGAHPVMIRKDEVNLGVRETVADTARTFSRYVDGIMIRTYSQGVVEELADHAGIPVINGLTDEHHPCQILADLLTVQERLGSCTGKKLTFIGDGNNIAHSLLEGGAMMGMDVVIACPKGHNPLPVVMEKAQQLAQQNGGSVQFTDNVLEAAKNAHVLYTDVWASMGQESEITQRQAAFQGFQINDQIMSVAAPDAIVLHCLPAHRGEEITGDVFERYSDVIFDQAENRLHAQKAIMVALLA